MGTAGRSHDSLSFTDLCLRLKAHQSWVLAVILTTYVHFKAVSPTFIRFLNVITGCHASSNFETGGQWTKAGVNIS